MGHRGRGFTAPPALALITSTAEATCTMHSSFNTLARCENRQVGHYLQKYTLRRDEAWGFYSLKLDYKL